MRNIPTIEKLMFNDNSSKFSLCNAMQTRKEHYTSDVLLSLSDITIVYNVNNVKGPC